MTFLSVYDIFYFFGVPNIFVISADKATNIVNNMYNQIIPSFVNVFVRFCSAKPTKKYILNIIIIFTKAFFTLLVAFCVILSSIKILCSEFFLYIDLYYFLSFRL